MLNALQGLSDEDVPFTDILLCKQNKPGVPKYIQEFPRVDVTPVLKHDVVKKVPSFDVTKQWLDPSATLLDASQSTCLHHMLNNEVSITQGPPGTGLSL